MRVLFSGFHNPHFITITEYIESAIKALGHDLIIFDDRRHIIPGIIRQRMQWLHQFDLQHINKEMVSLASKTKPDVAIVTGGHRITGLTVKSLKDNGIVTVLWTIDAPLNFQPILDVASYYDHVFCQGTEAIELLNHAGIKGAIWLPVACDPNVHKPVGLSPEEKRHYGNDVAFVGSYYPNREELFEKLTDFNLGIWGPGWEKLSLDSPLRKFLRGDELKPEAWSKVYSASKIILATHYQDPENRFPVYQASPRIFEALACGAFVISDNQRDVFSLFKEGEHLARFVNPDDLVEKIRYYLEHPEERKKIARLGRLVVLQNHTYVHRIEKLLSVVSRN
ncbi:MAG: glycosyltransferase [Deltaproteobacteria bacterium]|nr:glycosyltransferase [Deltaproteobacteria bacterium]